MLKSKSVKVSLLLSFLFLAHIELQAFEQSEITQTIKQQLQTSEKGLLMIGQSEISTLKMIQAYYQQNDYHLAWKNQAMLNRLFEGISYSFKLGLTPQDYHFTEIKQRLKSHKDNELKSRVQLDILMTDAFLRLAYHLRFGKVVAEELDQDWNLRREFMTADPLAKIKDVLDSEKNLDQFLNQLTELGDLYDGLIKALAQYRQIQKEGGWQTIPQGPVIKADMQDERIPLIQSRLQLSGYLQQTTDSDHYEAFIEEAVKRFQKFHSLDADGILGNDTLSQMNISVAQRINQIKANLERVRWIKHNLDDEFVLVNVAGFKVFYFRDNQLIWQAKAQVGTDYRKTPIFRDDIEYIAFNPTWTIPPTILSKDILPKLRKDADYLQKKNMNVIDSKGNIIDKDSINWSDMTIKNFPYMIRQEPGPGNALGRVKMMFPNKHLVYLHDTPSKELFARTDRAFSSGCIRVERPFELVELLLNDKNKWHQSSFDQVLDSGKLQNVRLPKTVPVFLLYFTTIVDKEGQLTFYKDVYDRDEKIIKGLNDAFKLVQPDINRSISHSTFSQ